MASFGKRVEACWSLSTCALIFDVTFGLAWPTEMVTIPPKKSRYFFPSESQRYCMLARSVTSGSAKYVLIEGKRYCLCLRRISSLVIRPRGHGFLRDQSAAMDLPVCVTMGS